VILHATGQNVMTSF